MAWGLLRVAGVSGLNHLIGAKLAAGQFGLTKKVIFDPYNVGKSCSACFVKFIDVFSFI